MAITPTPPLPENRCIGQLSDGTPQTEHRCLKGHDVQGNKIYTCAGMRFFLVQCPKINQLCSSLSGAWVASVTVCNQKLF